MAIVKRRVMHQRGFVVPIVEKKLNANKKQHFLKGIEL
jgi:hypothetical protein